MALTDMPLPPGVEICLAKAEDYEDVMAINKNVNNSVDYLPKKYMEYINNSNRLCLVLKKDGRTVAFGMSYVVDGGTSAIQQAGRVHADFQGQKFSNYLGLVGTKYLSRKYKIERMIWTSANRKESDIFVEKQRDVKYVVVRPRFSLDFSPLELEHALKRPQFQEFQDMSQKYNTLTLTPSSVKEVLTSSPQDVTSMLPEGFWVVNWEPFQPMKGNYDLITKDTTVYVTMTTDGSLLAVSYGTPIDVPIGLRYRADYYVRPGSANNKELFVSHFVKHLIQIHQFYRGKNVSYSMVYPQKVSKIGLDVKKMVGDKLDLQRKQSSEADCLLLVNNLPVENPASKL